MVVVLGVHSKDVALPFVLMLWMGAVPVLNLIVSVLPVKLSSIRLGGMPFPVQSSKEHNGNGIIRPLIMRIFPLKSPLSIVRVDPRPIVREIFSANDTAVYQPDYGVAFPISFHRQ